METLQGTVGNCQHTIQVSGGGKNSSASTTYIALFRVNNRPVEYRTSRPNSVSDGDQVVVAGTPTRSGSLRAYACRNVTTGESTDSGIWGNVFGLIFLPIVAAIMILIFSAMFGHYAFYLGVTLLAVVIVLMIRQIVLIQQAKGLVNG